MKQICRTNRILILLLMALFMTASLPYNANAAEATSSQVRINIKKKTINYGKSFTLKITGTKSKVKWSVSNAKILKVKNGKVTGVGAGKAVVSAKVSGRRYRCSVTVKPVISKKTAWIGVSDTLQLKLNGALKKVKWSSGNKKIATVSSNGKVTAKASGTVTIKAKCGNGTYKCTIHVWKKNRLNSVRKAYRIVNEERARAGVKKVSLDYKLSLAAMERSRELDQLFSHVRPDGSSCFTIFDDYKFNTNSYKGENVAYGFNTAVSVMDAWMASEGHRENILSADFDEIGVGVVVIDGVAYWTMLFYGN